MTFKTSRLSFLIVLTLLLFHFRTPALIAQDLLMHRGLTLSYKAFRGSTVSGAYQTSEITDIIMKFNESTIIYQRYYATPIEAGKMNITIKYSQGVPVFVSYLPALIYLPPKCIEKALNHDLEWIRNITTSQKWVKIASGTAQTLNFTVEAGTFQCLNVTLKVAGWETGTLTLIYDLSSGVLIYEAWITEYGEYIIQELISFIIRIEKPPIILNIGMFAATIFTPTATLVRQLRRKMQKGREAEKIQTDQSNLKSVFPPKAFYISLAGALLSLISTLLPWGRFSVWQIFLPLGLASIFIEAPPILKARLLLQIISLTAHATAIIAWISIAMHLYTYREYAPQLVGIAAGILALASAALFVQTGLTPSWGLPTNVIAGILMITSILAANIKIEIEISTEEMEE